MQQMENNETDIKKIKNKGLPDKLLLFDGVCNLCDRSVQFIIRHDPKAIFKFAALQSDYAQNILPQLLQQTINKNVQPELTSKNNLFSIIFIQHRKIYLRSTAILKVMQHLGFPWNLLTVSYILPRGIRDRLYDYIASHRYKWYGKKDSCMVPTPELKQRFMDANS
ncbi:thiol-disulfide oxidoreductase DCC family protein [Arachidicoccus ginsenosidivorans]|nr:thiol-disulfide oxidoreductase DCC family protein [Arachidicoccus ginsenosidivorans]